MIRLTQTVQKGGCAAKVAASELRKILSQVKFPPKHDALLVDGSLFDDAAIYKVTPDTALVQTLDFFTPIVDSPRIFGRVAAANALSDVYAMGGIPKTAMAILAFPLATLDQEVIVEVLQGACDALADAKVSLVGGHSIDDDTLKFGLSVTGYVHPEKVWSNAGARPGDVLLLTKALGTGTMTAALKRSLVTESDISDVLTSMGQLNDVPACLTPDLLSAVHSATDITGFGLSGHAMQMAKASKVRFELELSRLPVFAQAFSMLQEKILTKAHSSNAAYTKEAIQYVTELPEEKRLILFDPQTSGGLLLSVAPEKAEEMERALKLKFPFTTRIGLVREASAGDSLLQIR